MKNYNTYMGKDRGGTKLASESKNVSILNFIEKIVKNGNFGLKNGMLIYLIKVYFGILRSTMVYQQH